MKATVSGAARFHVATALSLLSVTVGMNVASAQQLFSFETADNPATPAVDESLEGWARGFGSAVSVGTTTEAASDGSHSLKIEKQPGYQWDVSDTVNAADTVRYPVWNSVASNLAGYTLDFDVITTADSFAHAPDISSSGYFLLDVSTNSTQNAFKTVFNVAPPGNMLNTITTWHASIPMTQLAVEPNSGYYQLNFGSNSSTYTPGPNGEGLRYYVDNIHFSVLAPPKQTVSETLFSWETADNPATPTVNEQFEGWTEGYQPGHTHSIVALPAHGPTERSHALNIHRVDLDNAPDDGNSAFFTWGSQYILNSDPNQNGQIDSTVQQKIGSLTGKINSATRVAFDVSFDPLSFDANPSFARFGLSFDDGTHSFQAEFPSFNPLSSTSPTTIAMDMPLTAFTAAGLNLGTTDLNTATHFFRITMSTNVNGLFAGGQSTPIDFQVDNFRLITEISGVPGDYDNDGVVDAGDYVAWRKAMATPNAQLLNEVANTTPGTVTADDYAAWRARFGNTAGAGSSLGAGSGVPEPSSFVLVGLALGAFLLVAPRKAGLIYMLAGNR